MATAGRTLAIDGLPVSVTDYLKAGDWISLGSTSDARLHILTADADSDGSGECTTHVATYHQVSRNDEVYDTCWPQTPDIYILAVCASAIMTICVQWAGMVRTGERSRHSSGRPSAGLASTVSRPCFSWRAYA